MNRKYVLTAICGLTLIITTGPAFAQMGSSVQKLEPAAAKVEPTPVQRPATISPQQRVDGKYEYQENIEENPAAKSFYEDTREPYPNLEPLDPGLEPVVDASK